LLFQRAVENVGLFVGGGFDWLDLQALVPGIRAFHGHLPGDLHGGQFGFLRGFVHLDNIFLLPAALGSAGFLRFAGGFFLFDRFGDESLHGKIDDLAGRLDVSARQLADVHHARAFRSKVHERAVGFQADHFAFHGHLRLDLAPLHAEGFDHRQFDAVLADAAHPGLHVLTGLEYVFHFVDRVFLNLRNVEDAG